MIIITKGQQKNKLIMQLNFQDMEVLKVIRIEDLQFSKQIQQFTQNLQKGDLGLSKIIQYGFVTYGQTRSGKTSTGHLLSGNVLKANKIKGEDMVQVVTSKNRKAIIGNTMNSQTVIPNFFQVKLFQYQKENQIKQSMHTQNYQNQQQTKAYVIDTPGYGDTYGVLRILANGYFHYRMYSRVKNMKFILCFDSNELKNTAFKFISTIVQFTSYFNNYLEKKQQIWQSCVFLFTKVDQSVQKLQDLCEKLEAIADSIKTQLTRNVQNAIRQFIKFIVRQKRVFCIKKYKKGESCATGHLLKQIDDKIPRWWSRSMNKQKGQVDMEPILFSLAKQITIATTSSDLSQRQFAQLTRYYNIRINEIVKEGISSKSIKGEIQAGLSFVLNELVEDAMGSPDDKNFLNVMDSYIKTYYQHFDLAYKQDRQKMEKQLFYQNPSSPKQQNEKTSQKKFHIRDKNYLVKKFNVLKQIEQLKQQINFTEFQDRNLGWLQKCQTYLYQIIKSLCKISYKKNNATQIVYKYGYLIHRIVEQAKMFLLLTKLSTTAEGQRRLKQAADNQIIDLMRSLKDFMGLSYNFRQKQVHYEELHLMFIKSFQLQDEKYRKLQINEKLIDFFCDIDTPDEKDNEKIIQLILLFSEQYLNSSEERPSINTKSTQNLLIRLLNGRSNCQSAYYSNLDENHQINQVFLIRRTSQQLGKLLQCLKNYKLARKVFKTIKYVDSVCRLYKQQLESFVTINNKNNLCGSSSEQQFELRIEYAEYLANHFRQQEAMKILQESFEKRQNISQYQIIKNQMSELMLRSNDKDVNKYAQGLFNGEYFQNLNEELQQEIARVVQCNNVDI